MLVCLDEAEMLGAADDKITTQPPATVVAMACAAGLDCLTLDGLSVDGQPLMGVTLELTASADRPAG